LSQECEQDIGDEQKAKSRIAISIYVWRCVLRCDQQQSHRYGQEDCAQAITGSRNAISSTSSF